MNKFYRSLLAISGVLMTISLPATAWAKTPDQTNGILYKISGKGLAKPSYLFGTVHVICTADMFPSEKLGGYLDQTDRLVMEINLGDMGEMMEVAKGLMLPEGKTLKNILTPEQYAKVDAMIFNALGIHADNVATMSPVALQVMILSSPKELGCTSPSAYELVLTQLAAAKKKPIEGLETAQFQRQAVDKIPVEMQAKMLYEMALDPEKSVTQFKQLIAVYKLQDSEKLYETISTQIGADKEMESQLVGDRNKTWIPKIETMIKEKPSFIAVGGGHLGGKGGLVNALRGLGYTVEAIKL
jgi:uncharacterized protein